MNQNSKQDREREARFLSSTTDLKWRVCSETQALIANGEFYEFCLVRINRNSRYNFSYTDIFGDTHGHPAPVSLVDAVKLVNSKEVRNVIPLVEVEEVSDAWRNELQAKIDAPCVETAFSADVKPKNTCPWGNL
jgi:hypothetical protein